MLNENSLAARILRPRRDSLATYRSQAMIPRRHFDAVKEKAESKREWGSIVLRSFVEIPSLRGLPFDSEAVRRASRLLISDDIDYPDPPSWGDVKVKYWDIVPNPGDLRFPMCPRNTKQFIYGDNWIAFRRIG
jgi:hypothetical protein